jgi:hypothetical protein
MPSLLRNTADPFLHQSPSRDLTLHHRYPQVKFGLMIRLTFDSIIPSFAPLILEAAAQEYAAAELLNGEVRLGEAELRQVSLAAMFIAVEATAIHRGFDRDRVLPILIDSVFALREYPTLDRRNAVMLADTFASHRAIRDDEEQAFEDWIAEALWSHFQTIPYKFPSAMAVPIAQALRIVGALEKVELEIDERAAKESQERLDQIRKG